MLKAEINRLLNEVNKSGFTLIELLVVVLIIGILTAIAIPQYQKAVLKSKAGQVMSLVRSVANAQESYYLANGQYSDSFDKLDLTLPSSEACIYDYGGPCMVVGDWRLQMYCGGGECGSIEAAYYESAETDYIVGIVHYLMNARTGNAIRENSGNLTCVAGRSGEQKTKGQQLCKALGGILIEDSGDRYFRL